jgi:hypothetical protein
MIAIAVVSFPLFAASPDGQHVIITFYDKRNDTGQGYFVDFYLAESVDAISAETADPDGDGIPNLAEYDFGFEPNHPDTGPLRIARGRLWSKRDGITFLRASDGSVRYPVYLASIDQSLGLEPCGSKPGAIERWT